MTITEKPTRAISLRMHTGELMGAVSNIQMQPTMSGRRVARMEAIGTALETISASLREGTEVFGLADRLVHAVPSMENDMTTVFVGAFIMLAQASKQPR